MNWAKSKTAIGIAFGAIIVVLRVNGWINDQLAISLAAGGTYLFGAGVAHKYEKRTDAIAKNGSK